MASAGTTYTDYIVFTDRLGIFKLDLTLEKGAEEAGLESGICVFESVEWNGDAAKIKIAPGTHSGKVLRLRGKGLPDVNGYGKGDILVVVDITIPTSLTSEEKELVKQLADKPHFKQAESVDNQNIFERMKSFFR